MFSRTGSHHLDFNLGRSTGNGRDECVLGASLVEHVVRLAQSRTISNARVRATYKRLVHEENPIWTVVRQQVVDCGRQ